MIGRYAPFFFGLGLGMVLVAVAWLASPREPDRREVETRARQLGMVYADEIPHWGQPGNQGSPEPAGGRTSPGTDRAGQGETAPPAAAEAVAGPLTPPAATATVTFTIKPGQSLGEIAAAVTEAGLAPGADTFLERIRAMGLARKVRADTYTLPINSSLEEVIKAITL